MPIIRSISPSSENRVYRFVYSFIRSARVMHWTDEKDRDFINEPHRAERCYEAAEFGCDGKTHAEVIEDWREAFSAMLKDRRGHAPVERFDAAVSAYFDAVELWHEQEGDLFKQIG